VLDEIILSWPLLRGLAYQDYELKIRWRIAYAHTTGTGVKRLGMDILRYPVILNNTLFLKGVPIRVCSQSDVQLPPVPTLTQYGPVSPLE
jgi:hypothetical protein